MKQFISSHGILINNKTIKWRQFFWNCFLSVEFEALGSFLLHFQYLLRDKRF